MDSVRDAAAAMLAAGQPAVLVEVIAAKGSVPREVGTRMLVAAHATAGTIGGGHLELRAIAEARELLASPDSAPGSAHYALGPSLGQCCGGAVTLGFARLALGTLRAWPVQAPRFHLQLYGAGHVGRAIARALAPLPVRVDWIDERDEEFPAQLDAAGGVWPGHIRKLCVDAVEGEVRHAPPGAFYLVLTHQHDIDLRITEAILRRGDFGFLGLIGSHTKRQRFVHRFEQRGIAADRIARLTCPIGLPGIPGKAPEVIAAAVVAQLLQCPAPQQRPGQSSASALSAGMSSTFTV
ncbi:MAG: xanthine dehydrogenase accessory protein XdhC [Rhizobacter sp.]|nr:xanthine dehydrogenase accessory protein XdhC [Rhizobacter sp.]